MREQETTDTAEPRRSGTGPAPIGEGTYWLAVSVLSVMVASLGPVLWLQDQDWLWFALLGGTVVGCMGVAYLLRRLWWVDERRKAVLHVIGHARSALEDAWEGPTPPSKADFGRHLLERLEKLEQQVPSARRDELQALERAARGSGRKRVQWLSPNWISCEGVSSVRQMELWGVPKNYVKGQLYPLLALTQGATPSASALEQIFDEYDYWEHYTEWYVRRVLPPITLVLVALFLEGLGWALYYGMWKHQLFPGFLLAGASGAALSILLKQSAMVMYGQLVKSWLGMAARFAMGLVATLVGFGLLGWGVVGIGFGGGGQAPVSIAQMVAECSECVDEKKQPCSWCDHPVSSKPDAGPPDGAPDAGAPAPVDAGQEAAPGSAVRATPAAPPTTVPAKPADVAKNKGSKKGQDAKNNGKDKAPTEPPCSVAWMAGLLGLGLLFGFSERAFMGILANFDSQFGSQREPVGKAPVGVGAPGAPSAPPAANAAPPPAPPPQNDELLDPDPRPSREDR